MSYLKRIDAVSVGKFGAVFGLIFGFIAAVALFAVGGLLATIGPSIPAVQTVAGYINRFGAVLLLIGPLAGAVFGFLCYAIEAFLYNTVAPVVGALSIDLKGDKLNSIEPGSLAKIAGVLGLIYGLIISVIIVIFLVPFLSAIPSLSGFSGYSVLLIPFVTVFAGVGGLIGGFLYAIIYNAVANKIGGIKFSLVNGELKSVELMSLVKMLAVLGVIYGLISGVLSFNPINLVVNPISDFISSAIGALIFVVLYNFLAGVIGGVRVEIA